MEELKAIVRRIRSGEIVDGYNIINHTRLVGEGREYTIQGTERIRITEIIKKPKESVSIPKKVKEPRKPKETPRKEPKQYIESKVCECGETFAVSKFNQNVEKCPKCRKKKRNKSVSSDREFICPECGVPFVISKFQPYHNPERCPKCSRKKNRKNSMANH